MDLLVLVGSLRADSLNRRLARAALATLPPGVQPHTFDRLGDLPHYNEEQDGDAVPEVVADLRRQIAGADAVLVVTPEYNGLLSGVTKNAIDWGSRPRGGAALAGRRVAVLSATGSPRGGEWARESTVRALTVAGADVLPQTVGVGSAHEALDGDTLVDERVREAVTALMGELLLAEPAAA